MEFGAHLLFLEGLMKQCGSCVLRVPHHPSFLGWLYSLLDCCSGYFPRVCALPVCGPIVPSFFCTSTAHFSGDSPCLAEHTCSGSSWQCSSCVYPADTKPIPHFTLMLRCAVLIFNLIIVIVKKEERRCSNGHRQWSGTPTRAPPWRVLDTERWQCCVFFLLLGLELPCKRSPLISLILCVP